MVGFQVIVELFWEEAEPQCLPIISLGDSTVPVPVLGVFWWLPRADAGL